MITPLVYENHDDNDSRHIWMHDPVAPIVNILRTQQEELHSIKWYIIHYIPCWILNKFKVNMSMTQSISLKVKFITRNKVSNTLNIPDVSLHMKNAINVHVHKYIINIKRYS